MRRNPLLLLSVWLFAIPGLASAADPFYLKDGDRVVFYGDSITDQRLYTTFVETYVVTRFPKLNVTFTHSGWGGDRVGGGGGGPIETRLNRDVFAYKPTVMTIMLGMNDASYRAFDKGIFDTYARGMKHIVEAMKGKFPNIRITLIRPSPFDDVTRPPVFEGGYNAVLVRYGDYLKELAAEAHLDLADLNASVVAATKKAHESDSKLASQLNPDRVHPGPGGQLLMAAALLDAWKAPALVSKVTLKVEGNDLKSEAEKSKIADAKRDGQTLTWTQTDEALPFPINLKDRVTALAERSSDIVKDLDQEILTVTGLDGESFTLKIDDKEVGHFTKAQLAEGVNLAVLDTPMVEQAKAVHALTLKHNDIHFTRWRFVQVPLESLGSPHVTKAMNELDELDEDLVEQQRSAAQPKPRKYELRPKS
jgi:lysophospholipase L1-like esterase